MRIYAVKKPDILGRELKAANAFDGGKRKRAKTTTGKKARKSPKV